jgi:L-fuconolactonase
VIDAHQHFWRLDRGDYGWLTPALAPIHRDFGPDDLAPILARHGITRTILVQAAPTEAETGFLLDIARTTPWVAGVVGWTDFEAGDAAERIARLAADDKLVGLRPMVQDLADDRWLERRSLSPAFEAMIDHRLVFDALVLPRHLRSLLRVVERHPTLDVVVDHGAKPRIRERALAPWRAALAEVASHPRVTCKLSGLLTEAAPEAPDASFAPYLDTLLEAFGPKRLLWGSDWPVVNLAGGYDRWRAITLRALEGVSLPEREAILGGTAERIYVRA